MSELVFEGISVRFGGHRSGHMAVDDVSLTVPSGKVVGLVGESGSGKSTLARTAVGLAPLSMGRVLLDGVDVRRPPRRGRRPIQMIFQDPYSTFDPRMTIGESISETMRGMPASERRREIDRLLTLVKLDPGRSAQRPSSMSGGQRQRAAIARALAASPDVIIADEITSALDVSVQSTVLNLVKDVQRELGVSMLFIAHNLAVVRYVSDFVAVMQGGRLLEFGATEDVLRQPEHPYTSALVNAVPSFADSDRY